MKKIITVLVAVFFAATCSEPTSTVAQESKRPADIQSTTEESVTTIGKCKSSPIRPINISFGHGQISVNPPRQKAYRGDVLRFNVPANVDEIVYIGGKDLEGVWIDENSTKGADKFFVCVDPELNIPEGEKKTYKYFVFVPRVGYIDPEVIVRH